MQPKRILTIGIAALCWGAAASSILIGWPEMKWRGFLLATALGLLIVDRTAGPNVRRIAHVFYQQGVHDALKKAQTRTDEDGTLRAG